VNKESFFINLFNNSFIGDDVAVIGDTVYSQDYFVEDVHFKKDWFSYYQVGYKAMLVNISDAICKGAIPRYALVSAALPSSVSLSELRELAKGLLDAANRHGVKIVGGDTISFKKIALNITVIAFAKKPILRKGMKEGDLIAYTGKIGEVAKCLKKLKRGNRISSNSKFYKPVLKDSFIFKAKKYVTAAMDISDGLFEDLSRMLKSNKRGAVFLNSVSKRAGCSGEEYEILFSFSPKNKKAIKKIAEKCRTKITIFAKAKRGVFKNICSSHHFKR
jgi:thiamine-monophosphate kinase